MTVMARIRVLEAKSGGVVMGAAGVVTALEGVVAGAHGNISGFGNLSGVSGNFTGDMRAATFHVGATAGVDGTVNVGAPGNLTFSKGILTAIAG